MKFTKAFLHNRRWRLAWSRGKGLVIFCIVHVGVALLALAAPSSVAAQVNGYGNSEHLEFTGNASFTSPDIRQALIAHARFLTASQPGASLEEFLSTIQEELLSGYQRNGFPETRVELDPAPTTERIAVKIHEGPRFRCRNVRVSGTTRAIAAELISCLTNPPAATADRGENPRWTPGESACFDPGSLPALRKAAEERLATLGWFFPELALRIETIRETGVADLIVKIQSLGPPGRAQEIIVSGNRQNATQDILRFLNFKRGSSVTSDSLSESQTKLRNSGRFLEATIKPEAPEPALQSKGIRLVIQVREYDLAPGLLAVLSEKHQALLKVCDWLTRFGSRSDDAVLEFAIPPGKSPGAWAGQLVLSPRSGVLLKFDNASTGPAAGYSLLISRKLIGVLALQHNRKLLIQDPDLSPNAGLSLSPDASGSDNPFNLTFGMGWQAGTQAEAANDANAPVLSFDLLPAAFLHLTSDTDGVYHVQHGTFTMTNRYGFLKAKARTGEVLAYNYADSDVSISLRFRKGDFGQAGLVWQTGALACSNSYQLEHPLASLVSFFSGELARQLVTQLSSTNTSSAQRHQALNALDQLLSVSIFAPLDTTSAAKGAGEFYFPKDDVDHDLEQSGYPTVFPWLLARDGGGICPWGSWPTRLLMDGCMVCGRQSSSAVRDLRSLCTTADAGPVRCLAAAKLASYFNLPVARSLAQRGLQCLSATGFRADCNRFVGGGSGTAQSFANMCTVLGRLPAADVDALAGSLPPTAGALLRKAYQEFRGAPSQPPSAFIVNFLEASWSALSPAVEAALRNLVSPSDQSASAK